MISSDLCIRCKGKLLCGLKTCPVLERFNAMKTLTSSISGNEFSGSSPPGIFVSWHNYPKVDVAPLASPDIDSGALLGIPEQWYGLPADRIISFRERLIRSNTRIEANSASVPTYSVVQLQELAMASKPAAVEITLKKKPSPRLLFNPSVAPMGPAAEMKKMQFIENPSIPRKVDYLVSDSDVKTAVAMQELYNSGTPVSTIYRLLSTGTLGIKRNRKFVPTRWSISAVDSNLSKQIVDEKVKYFPQISEFQIFHSKYLDNNFYVLLIPSSWAFEQLECWLPDGLWTSGSSGFRIIQDHEFYAGRKTYASNVEGAYYAARLAVAEHLAKRKKQAAAVIFREIGQGYSVPLGVWVIRENIRHALRQKPLTFGSMESALSFLYTKLSVAISNYKKESKLLDYFRCQRKITDYFS